MAVDDGRRSAPGAQKTDSATGRARRIDADRNVETIVQAGLSVLARNPRASMGAIASASGLARATVYGHFPNNAALVQEIFARAIAEVEQALAGLAEEAERVTLERFIRVTWASSDPYRLVRTMVPSGEVTDRAGADRHPLPVTTGSDRQSEAVRVSVGYG